MACFSAAEQFATQLCGEFERYAMEERWGAKTSELEIREKTDRLFTREISGEFSTSEYTRNQSYNVLREHLADDLADTRACRQKIGVYTNNECLDNNCRKLCTNNKNDDLKQKKRAFKRHQTCLNNFHSSCLVRCRMDARKNTYPKSSSNSSCENHCANDHNPQWRQECEETAPPYPKHLTQEMIETRYEQCFTRCSR